MHDTLYMQQALELAKKGEGYVEPNPMVGCVIVQNNEIVGQGYHTQFGSAHAEAEAIQSANVDLTDATCYVNLEPCSFYGKTPPCVDAIIQSGIRRVVIAMRDPNPQVNGRGIRILEHAGISVTEHVLEEESRRLNAPYLTLLNKNRPWIHAKWAMTLDGRLASKTNDSQWISGEESRKIAHQLRSRMDAVVIGSGTAMHDNPMLTVRLDESEYRGNKTPCRVVLDRSGRLSPESNLVQTARKVPVLIVTETNNRAMIRRWEQSGCEVLRLDGGDFLSRLLEHFSSRRWSHVLVEGGHQIFGLFFDSGNIDEVHAFIAPKLIGGESAIPVLGGSGLAIMSQSVVLASAEVQFAGHDVYVRGRVC